MNILRRLLPTRVLSQSCVTPTYKYTYTTPDSHTYVAVAGHGARSPGTAASRILEYCSYFKTFSQTSRDLTTVPIKEAVVFYRISKCLPTQVFFAACKCTLYKVLYTRTWSGFMSIQAGLDSLEPAILFSMPYATSETYYRKMCRREPLREDRWVWIT
jgi:hypothetical protein